MKFPWKRLLSVGTNLVQAATGLQLKNEPQQTTAPDVTARLAVLEKNERDQAQLVKAMAEQLNQIAAGTMKLHMQLLWLTVAVGVIGVVAIVALVVAFAR